MDSETTQILTPTFEYEVDLENYFYQHFDDVMASAGLDLLIVERQPSLPGSRLDLLALDRDALPWIIELKAGTAASQAVSQALRYTDVVDRMTLDDFLALPGINDVPTLDQRFKLRFGRDFTIDPDRIPGVLLIANEYDAEARQMITTLQKYDAPVMAFRYAVNDVLTEVTLEALDPMDLSKSNPKRSMPAAPQSVKAMARSSQPQVAGPSPYRVPVCDDVKVFWQWFSTIYPHPVAPVALIIQKYAIWQARTTTKALPPPSRNIGILCREIKKLALEKGEWVRVYYRQDCTTRQAADPTHILQARSRRGMPYTKVAYVKTAELDQHVKLIS